MKALAILLLSAGLSIFALGCASATPEWTAGAAKATPINDPQTGTHANHILRNWGIDGLEAWDDTDRILLLDTPSRMTPWNVR